MKTLIKRILYFLWALTFGIFLIFLKNGRIEFVTIMGAFSIFFLSIIQSIEIGELKSENKNVGN